MAIIQSGVTVRMTVHHNMPEEAMKRMDRQYTRSYIHQLAFSGESNTALLASALRLSCAFDMGLNPSGGGGSAVGDADMDIYLMNNPQIRESVEAANRVRVMVDATPTALAVAHWLIARVAGFEHPTQYLQQLGEPTHVGPESPIHAVRRRLVTARTQKVENKNYVYLLLRGWNAYAAGETMAKASIAPLRGKFALPDPLPWGQTESLVD